MRLGPPVCLECQVIMVLDHNTWFCPSCYSEPEDQIKHLFQLSPSEQVEFSRRTKAIVDSQ